MSKITQSHRLNVLFFFFFLNFFFLEFLDELCTIDAFMFCIVCIHLCECDIWPIPLHILLVKMFEEVNILRFILPKPKPIKFIIKLLSSGIRTFWARSKSVNHINRDYSHNKKKGAICLRIY